MVTRRQRQGSRGVVRRELPVVPTDWASPPVADAGSALTMRCCGVEGLRPTRPWSRGPCCRSNPRPAGPSEILCRVQCHFFWQGPGWKSTNAANRSRRRYPGRGGYLGSRAEVIDGPVQTPLDCARDEPMPIGALAGRQRTAPCTYSIPVGLFLYVASKMSGLLAGGSPVDLPLCRAAVRIGAHLGSTGPNPCQCRIRQYRRSAR